MNEDQHSTTNRLSEKLAIDTPEQSYALGRRSSPSGRSVSERTLQLLMIFHHLPLQITGMGTLLVSPCMGILSDRYGRKALLAVPLAAAAVPPGNATDLGHLLEPPVVILPLDRTEDREPSRVRQRAAIVLRPVSLVEGQRSGDEPEHPADEAFSSAATSRRTERSVPCPGKKAPGRRKASKTSPAPQTDTVRRHTHR